MFCNFQPYILFKEIKALYGTYTIKSMKQFPNPLLEKQNKKMEEYFC